MAQGSSSLLLCPAQPGALTIFLPCILQLPYHFQSCWALISAGPFQNIDMTLTPFPPPPPKPRHKGIQGWQNNDRPTMPGGEEGNFLPGIPWDWCRERSGGWGGKGSITRRPWGEKLRDELTAFPFTRGWETTTPSFVMAREKTFSSSSGEFQPWAVLPLKEAGFYRSPLCSDMSGLTRGGVNRERCTQSRLWFPAKYKHPLVLIYTIFLLN